MSSIPSVESAPRSGVVNLGKYFAGAGVFGLILVLLVLGMGFTAGSVEAQKQIMGSYLYGLVFWTSMSMAMYALTCFNHMVRPTWSLGVLRMLEAGGGWITLLIMGLGFIPIAMKLSIIYPWADPATVAASKQLMHKAPYLNTTFWTIRLVFYFAVWIISSYLFRQSVLKQEATKDFAIENRRMSFGAPSFLLFAATGTFAFIDWVMSLEPLWSSTMYSLWFMIGASLGAYALCVIMFNLNSDKPPFSTFVTKNVLKDQGNILFVHTMLWGYTSLSQYLIIWNGNLPENTSYYIRRSQGGWNALGLATIIGQFFIPFFLLISPRTKKNSQNLRAVAGWMFFVHVIDYTLIVAPALPGRLGTVSGLTIWDAVSWLGFASLFICGFSLMFRQAAPFPTYDTRLQEAKAHAH